MLLFSLGDTTIHCSSTIKKVYYFKATFWNPSPYATMLQQHVPHPPNHEAAMPPQPQRIGITVPEGPSIISGEIDDTFESEYLITVKSDFEDFFYHQIPMNQELQNQDLPASTTTAKVGISKQTPRGKKFINN